MTTSRIFFQRTARSLTVATASLVLVIIPCTIAAAAWTTSGSGSGGGAAAVMPSGIAPTGSPSGNTVDLRWSAVTLSSGAAVGGYIVSRFDAASGTQAAIGGTCTGVVASTACTDSPVPAGSWVYTVTPVLQSWTGTSSPNSSVITTLT